jgi:ribosomal protein S18 acetylase RimI-like enzyme
MASWRARSDPPWYGVDETLLRRLDVHETRVHGLGAGRELVDLGDALGLFDRTDSDPFYNRFGAIRWPADPAAFDERLDAILGVFAERGREPYVWLAAGFHRPADLADRLRASGFVEVGNGALVMILVDDPRKGPIRALPPGALVERLTSDRPDRGRDDAAAAALVIAEAFGITVDRQAALAVEIESDLDNPAADVRLVRVRGDPVAVGRRHDGDGLGYISAIGVRRAWYGLGLGEAVTRALVEAALDEGVEQVYLGVYADNAPALAVYQRVGFAILGGPALELLRP